eukprot:7647945-Alexandrium_andersonii.AAC.1
MGTPGVQLGLAAPRPGPPAGRRRRPDGISPTDGRPARRRRIDTPPTQRSVVDVSSSSDLSEDVPTSNR